jgi:hypothetical protein
MRNRQSIKNNRLHVRLQATSAMPSQKDIVTKQFAKVNAGLDRPIRAVSVPDPSPADGSLPAAQGISQENKWEAIRR